MEAATIMDGEEGVWVAVGQHWSTTTHTTSCPARIRWPSSRVSTSSSWARVGLGAGVAVAAQGAAEAAQGAAVAAQGGLHTLTGLQTRSSHQHSIRLKRSPCRPVQAGDVAF